jgi:enamine deaminase RidA (YjgF/YER057c/UK114 family)
MELKHTDGSLAYVAKADYSAAVTHGDTIYISGLFGSDTDGVLVSEDFREQARATFRNIGSVLEDCGAGFEDLISIRTFLLRQADFPAYVEVRREFLKPPFPATLGIIAPEFAYPGMLIEMEALARNPARSRSAGTC